ncbi:MAG: PaaI family thioesterase [bacterium]
MKPEDFAAIDPALEAEIKDRIHQYAPYPRLLGLRMEEVRRDYARMRLPYRPDLNQPAGMVHGGAIASLIDTVVVGTIFSNVTQIPRKLLTIDMHVHYLDAAVEEDVIAEGLMRRRGRSIVFLQAEVRTASGKDVAHGELSYKLAF